ncbi:MAG: VPLPA-CTERM sorting domain-containing protein [Gammaproteobacteria bacterium]
MLAPTPVPLPAAAWLLAPALAGLVGARRRG